jgi:hypothetical protein
MPALKPADTGLVSARIQAMESRSQEIRSILQLTAASFGSSMPEGQPMLELGPTISQLDSPELVSLVDLFFQHYHKHCPIIHRPSFQPADCPPALLLAVVALGGMYAPEKPRVERMRSLLDVIELYIYNLPGLREEYLQSFDLSKAADELHLHSQFQVLQSAYLIVVAQYFSGNIAAKRRARRQRFMRILDVSKIQSSLA